MLDGSEFFECACYSDQHTIRFVYDKHDNVLHLFVFLNQYRPWWKRLWVAIKYLFNYKCQYGHWDTWEMNNDDAERLKKVLNQIC